MLCRAEEGGGGGGGVRRKRARGGESIRTNGPQKPSGSLLGH